ncbi:MAG: hypothetical protein GPOALKHO_001589 [Sodalis sp.]|nr:MAG: hypothetical protein GPOALKHO_001589 [Sodalis sp.]
MTKFRTRILPHRLNNNRRLACGHAGRRFRLLLKPKGSSRILLKFRQCSGRSARSAADQACTIGNDRVTLRQPVFAITPMVARGYDYQICAHQARQSLIQPKNIFTAERENQSQCSGCVLPPQMPGSKVQFTGAATARLVFATSCGSYRPRAASTTASPARSSSDSSWRPLARKISTACICHPPVRLFAAGADNMVRNPNAGVVLVIWLTARITKLMFLHHPRRVR